MLEALLADVNMADFHAFVRSIFLPKDYLLTREILAETYIDSVKFRIKTNRRQVDAAKFRSFDAVTGTATRRATQLISEGMLPPLGQKLFVGELEQILLNASRGADGSELIELLYEDLERHVESIKARLELAAGQVLATGKFTLAENGVIQTADFAVPAANMPTPAVLWSDTANSTPITDELAWIAMLTDSRAPAPERVVTSRKAYRLLCSSKEYRAAYYNNAAGVPTATLAPDQVAVVRDRYNLPPVTLYDVTVSVDGAYTRTLPENLWLMTPPNLAQWGNTQYGVTSQALTLSAGGNPQIVREEAPGIVCTNGYQDDPAQIWTAGHAVAMPVLYTPDIHIAATVM